MRNRSGESTPPPEESQHATNSSLDDVTPESQPLADTVEATGAITTPPNQSATSTLVTPAAASLPAEIDDFDDDIADTDDDSKDFDQTNTDGDATALEATETEVAVQPDEHPDVADPGSSMSRRWSRPARPAPTEADRVARSGAFILTMTLVSALLISGLLLTLSNVTRLNAGPTQPVTHEQATPSPTTSAFPTPTAEPGFQLYVDRSDGFLIQYPSGWALSSLSPGIDFKDDPNSPGYIVQVLFPGSFTAPGGQGNTGNNGAFWVNYALNGLSTTLAEQGLGVLSRQTACPAPYAQPRSIGGSTWQCGAGYALLGVTPTPTASPSATPGASPSPSPTTKPGATPTGTADANACATGSCLQVVVLATVYHNRPYIISLLTSSDRFEAGDIEFFQPMLASFEFLPQP